MWKPELAGSVQSPHGENWAFRTFPVSFPTTTAVYTAMWYRRVVPDSLIPSSSVVLQGRRRSKRCLLSVLNSAWIAYVIMLLSPNVIAPQLVYTQ